MFLSGETLRRFVEDQQVIRPPQDAPDDHIEKLFDKICYQLTVGDEVYISSVDVPLELRRRQSVTIKPGEYAIIVTAERLVVPPEKLGLVSMKFRYTGLGLINVSGFHVDPGFSGNFHFAVYNAGPTPVSIKRLEPMFMLFFVEISDPQKYDGRHSNQGGVPAGTISALIGPPVSLRSLADRISSLENYNKVLIGLLVGLIVAVIGAILRIQPP